MPPKGKSRVLFLVNHDVVIYNFRLEIVERLLADGHEVHISSPYGERIGDLVALGSVYHEINIDRHGMNPRGEIRILREYQRLLCKVRPDIVLGFTVKPNIYGAIAARRAGIPFVANITGLGTVIEGGGAKRHILEMLYRYALTGVQKVFFQNEASCKYMVKRNLIHSPYEILPGSGVNLVRNAFEAYPPNKGQMVFTTVGRIMRDKGTDEILEAAWVIKGRFPNVTFRMVGFFDGQYQKKVEEAVRKGIVEYMGQQRDVHPFMAESNAIIHASYHEGMSNVLLEAAATGRPVLASNVPGCIEAFEPGVSGVAFEARDAKDLVRAITEFIALPYETKASMGLEGRKRMERMFDRNIVVGRYMDEVAKAGGTKNVHGFV